MTLDLTDDEAAALAKHLRHAIEYDPFPYAPRLDPLKAILAKLDPPVVRTKSEPVLRPTGHRPGIESVSRKRPRPRR
jgi:hypothetical protein